MNLSPEEDSPTVSYITKDTSEGHVKELGIDLSDSDLSGIQRGQLEDLLLSYADVFSRGKRDIGKNTAGVQHHIPPESRDNSSQTTASQSSICLSRRCEVGLERDAGRWGYREVRL